MIDADAKRFLRVTGNALAFNQITSLSGAVGINFSVSGAAAWASGTTYALNAVVTKNSKTFISRQASNTGHDPEAANSLYWVQVDATTGIPVGALWATLQCETQNVRWRNDGIDPSSTVGNLLYAASAPANNLFFYDLGDLSKLKVIEVTSSASLNVTFHGV